MSSAIGPTTAPVLRDPQLDAVLATERLVVTPLLNTTEVAELLRLHEEFESEDRTGLVMDFLRPDRAVMRELGERLAPFWDRHLPGLFHGYEVVVTSFVTKYPGDDSAMMLHSEPTFVDESCAATFNIWIPLVDVGPETDNGGLQVVPGSADLPVGTSGFDTPVLTRPYERYLRRYLVTVTAAAGDAVVYDSRLLHASEPNRTDVPRVAMAATVAPLGAPLRHVLAVGRRHRVDHEVDRDFFRDLHPNDIVRGIPERYRVVGEFDDPGTLRPEDVARCIDPSSRPRPEAVLPPDLVTESDPEQFEPLGIEAAGWTDPGHDCRVDPGAAEVAAPPQVELVGRTGTAFITGTGAVDASVRPTRPTARWGRRGRSRLVVLQPGSRLTLRRTTRRAAPGLTVLECPAVRSGARTAHCASGLELGMYLPVGDEPVTLWNDGPGPMVALLTTATGRPRG